jgi:hypothetical protein
MPVIPLVTLSQVVGELSGALPQDQSALPALILAASRAVQKYCTRDFAYWNYDETYDGNGFSQLVLRQYPINRIYRLSCNPTPAITIDNRDTSNNQIALVNLATIGDSDSGLSVVGLSLSATASGVTTSYGFFFNTPPVFTFTVAASGTGGSIAPGTYLCAYSIVGSSGESVPCPLQSVTVTSGQVLTFDLPLLPVNGTGYRIYVSTTNGGAGTITRQVTGVTGVVTLSSLTSGAAPAAAANLTIQALTSAINGLSTAWVAKTIQNFALYPTADIRPILSVQGALQGNGSGASLDVYATELSGYTPNYTRGIINLGTGGNYDPVFSLGGTSVFSGFPWGVQNIRVVYDAGFATVPADVQQAVICTIQDWIWQLKKAWVFRKETGDRYSYEFFDRKRMGLPDNARAILNNGWRSYRRN